MRKSTVRLAGSLLLILFPAFAAEQAQNPPGISPVRVLDLFRYLPDGSDLVGWARQGKPQIFKGEDLFLYIDGGAEIFHEYGFRQVAAQEYRNAGGKTISLEIYEMASAEAAYGMCTFKSSRKGKPIPIGRDGRLEDYYLNFWKGPCLVTLIGFDESPASLQGIQDVAKAVEAKIPDQGARPALMAIIPREWEGVSRRVYLRGHLGLFNIHAFFTRDLFRFQDAVAVEMEKFKIIVLRYSTAGEAGKRFLILQDAFVKNPGYKNLKIVANDWFEITDPQGRLVALQIHDNRINLVLSSVEIPNRQTTSDIFEKLNKTP